jgi:hypothetical protein
MMLKSTYRHVQFCKKYILFHLILTNRNVGTNTCNTKPSACYGFVEYLAQKTFYI